MHLANSNSRLEFAMYGLALAKGGGDLLSSVEIAKADFSSHRRVEVILRSAVNAGTTTNASALVSYQEVVDSFVGSLAAVSAFDAMLPHARRVPLRSRLAVVTTAASVSSVGETAPKPVTSLAIGNNGLDLTKAAALMVVSDELLRFAALAGAALINRELRAGVVAATNGAFLAGMAAGVVSTAASGDPLADLRTMLAAVATKGTSRLFLVISPAVANQLATYSNSATGGQAFPTMTPSGGTLAGVTALVSDQVPSDSNGELMLLIDADQIALSDETLTLDASRYADIAMDDAPDVGAQSMTSMFQTNSVALKAERWFGYQRLRDTAVAAVSAPEYPAP